MAADNTLENSSMEVRDDVDARRRASTWEQVTDAVRYGAGRVTGNRRH